MRGRRLLATLFLVVGGVTSIESMQPNDTQDYEATTTTTPPATITPRRLGGVAITPLLHNVGLQFPA